MSGIFIEMLSLEVNSLIWKLRKWTQRGCDLAMELQCNGDSKNTEIHVSETSLSSALKPEYIPHCFNNSFVVPETPPLVRRGKRQWLSNTNYQEIVIKYLLCGEDLPRLFPYSFDVQKGPSWIQQWTY